MQGLVMSLVRWWYGLRRRCRQRHCYTLFFVASFLSFVFALSYVWEGAERPHHDPKRDQHRNKVDLVGKVDRSGRRDVNKHDEGDQLDKPGLARDGGAVEGDGGGEEDFDAHVHEEWGDPSAVAVLRGPGERGNYEPSPDAEAGRSGAGEEGRGVPNDGNDDAVRRANSEFGFNTHASDKISMNRSIPDTRPDECQRWDYPKKLPAASVVIVFHNEGWTPLLRTVHSVLLRSPPHLLHEVLMVDDFSDKVHLKGRLEKYIKTIGNGKVRLHRNAEREGLIRARSIGAQEARGEVVIFLDAHCEVNRNWLPPLLTPIAKDRRVMTVPVIDGIDQNTWAYRPVYGGGALSLFRGIFEWGLLYKETEVPAKELAKRAHQSEPYNSPTHAGGLFAIDREWFAKLGFYDPGLQIWGGEQYELSFKIWQCGGGILWVPCSHVGHVYRNRMPYSFGKLSGPIVAINHKRVAAVWMDEYGKYYLRREPGIVRHDHGNIDAQLKIRRDNKCKSFKWFMENVAYDVEGKYPVQPENQVWGEARNPGSGKCIDAMGQPIPGTLGVSSCHGWGGQQMFRLNEEGQMTSGEWCVTGSGGRLRTDRCPFGSVSGKFGYDAATKQIRHGPHSCVEIGGGDVLQIAKCKDGAENQQWVWKEIYH